MLNGSLSKRIWLSFILLVLIVGLIVGLIYPISLQKALERDAYRTIEQVQLELLQNIDSFDIPDSNLDFIQQQQAERAVGHILIYQGLQGMKGDPVPVSVVNKMVSNASKQKDKVGEYHLDYQGATLYYVARNLRQEPAHAYLISYMWDTNTKQMMRGLWRELIFVLLCAGVAALVLGTLLLRYLKAPLKELGDRFEEIANFNWRKPFDWKSDDEFGKLSNQFEDMRKNLLRYDEAQKNFLQQASHELKTPIMVIQSYAQSVKDGISPSEKLDDTMDIIMEEAYLMEKRVKKLLYYTRVDSLRDEKPMREDVSFGELAEVIKERFANNRQEVAIAINGQETHLNVDPEQWLVVLENLMENALRYAVSRIELSAETKDGTSIVRIENDGEAIPESEMNTLFEPFNKGNKGQFGLGLAIVKRIVERHQGKIKAKNINTGVQFEITIPKK
ncbi:MAG: HAMP domain-containing sensor histidine kinase [Tuberibacillus sp.]